MRNGGEDIAQALALLGVRPVWDGPTRRMVDLEVIPLSLLGRPRVDVTLRISGLFRDAFPQLVAWINEATARVAALAGARVLPSAPGRGQQLALGAAHTEAPWLLFLHADVRLQPGWQAAIQRAINQASRQSTSAWWFGLAIAGGAWPLRLVEAAVAWRSRWRHLPYGDQGLLVSRATYQQAGGFAPLALMEDLDLVLRLRRLGPLRTLGVRLLVDGRRWHERGVVATSWRNWQLRRAWRRGTDSLTLARRYEALNEKASP